MDTLIEKDLDAFEAYEVECKCRKQLVNAGTPYSFIKLDNYGCPQHCTHHGINIFASDWRCRCGASHND